MRLLLAVLLLSGCDNLQGFEPDTAAQLQRVVGMSCSLNVKDYVPPAAKPSGQH